MGVLPRRETSQASHTATRRHVIGGISAIETIASGRGIRELARLRRAYGPGRWRKRKGIARIELSSGRVRLAEVHSYEAHGIGRKEFKIKRLITEV